MTLGSHGDQMVALPRHATVQGKPLPELVDEGTLEELFQRTEDGGGRDRRLPQEGERLLRAVLVRGRDGERDHVDDGDVHPTCAWTTGQYGISDVYLGVPAKLGKAGVDEIVELELNEEEPAQLTEAAEAIRAKCDDLASRVI